MVSKNKLDKFYKKLKKRKKQKDSKNKDEKSEPKFVKIDLATFEEIIDSLNAHPVMNTLVTPKISSSIEVYPNPANANVNINVPLEQDQQALVQIYDFRGKLILERSVVTDSSPLVFSTVQLNQGIYLYNVQIDGLNIKSGKLSIIH